MNHEFSCFHISTSDRVHRILKHGLVPNSERNRAANKTPHIMLSEYPAWKLYDNFKKNKGLILIEIRHPDIKREMFVNDPEGLAWGKVIDPKFFRSVVKFEVIK